MNGNHQNLLLSFWELQLLFNDVSIKHENIQVFKKAFGTYGRY